MGWSEWRSQTAGSLRNRDNTKRFPPWQAGVLMINAGDEFEAAIFDEQPYIRAYHWTDLPHECTSDNPIFDGKCVFCHDSQRRDEENERIEARGGQPTSYKHWRRLDYVLRTLDFRMFHFVPDPKKEGKFTVAACAFPELEVPPGSPDVCAWCKNQDKYVSERRFLGARRWEVGTESELWKSILAADRKAAQTCLHEYADGRVCGGRNYLTSIMCPECGHHYMDAEGIHKDAAGAVKLAEGLQDCPSCKKKAKPYSEYTCQQATKLGKDGVPEHMAVPGTLPKGVVRVTCRGDEKQVGGRTQVVRKYAVEPNLRDTAVGILMERFNMDEAAAVQLLSTKIDFARSYLPERKDPTAEDFTKGGQFNKDAYVQAVLTSQAEALGVPNPYDGSTTTHRPFGNRTQRTYMSEDEAPRD